MQTSLPPELPTPTDDELAIIQAEQKHQLYALVDAAGLKGGLDEALTRFTLDTPPLNVLLPSKVPERWFGISDWSAADAEVKLQYAHYFEEPKARGMIDPGSYATTQMMMDVTAQELQELGKLTGPKPLAANVPRGDIGATILSFPASERAIMFYPSGLYIYGGDIAKITSYFFQELSPDEISSDSDLHRNTISANINPGYAKWLAQAISAATVEDHPIQVDRIQIGRKQGFLAMQLQHYSQMFIFAHEIAHQELGHLSTNDLIPEQFVADEYAADRFAMEAICEIASRNKGCWTLGFWGCQLALLSFEMLHNALKIFDGRPRDAVWRSKYYPSVKNRRRALYQTAREIRDTDGLEAAERVVNMTCKALNELQYHVDLEHFMVKGVLKDVQPVPIWHSYLNQHYGAKTVETK